MWGGGADCSPPNILIDSLLQALETSSCHILVSTVYKLTDRDIRIRYTRSARVPSAYYIPNGGDLSDL